MTVDTTTSRVSYTGDGATSAYAYTTRVFYDSDLVVTVRDTATPPVETELSKGTHYTVSGAGTTSGGTVTLVASGNTWLVPGTAYLKSGYSLVIRRKPALLQAQPFRNLGAFYPNLHEDTFDYLLMMVQSLRDELDRAIRAPECDASALTRLLDSTSRASKYLGFDSSGMPSVLDAPAGTTAISAFIATLIDDADAATARTTLGATAGVWPATLGGTGLSAYGSARQFPRMNSAGTALEYVNHRSLVVQSKTTTYTALVSDDLILCSTAGGAWSLALPAAATCSGKLFTVRKTTSDTSALTIDPNGTETVGGSLTTSLNTLEETVDIVSDGSNWVLLTRRIPSPWTSFTPTGAWSANTTYTGRWRRVGENAEYSIGITTSGAPTAASLYVNLPSGHTIDTTKLDFAANTTAALGLGNARDAGASSYPIFAYYRDTTSMGVRCAGAASTFADLASDVTQANPFTWGASDALQLRFTVPISGWNA